MGQSWAVLYFGCPGCSNSAWKSHVHPKIRHSHGRGNPRLLGDSGPPRARGRRKFEKFNRPLERVSAVGLWMEQMQIGFLGDVVVALAGAGSSSRYRVAHDDWWTDDS